MNNKDLDQARITWNEIDIKQVRDVSWCSISFFNEQIAKALSSKESCQKLINRLLAERITLENLCNLQGAAIVCGDMEAEKHFFNGDELIRFGRIDGFDLSEVSLARRSLKEDINFNSYIIDCNDLMINKDTYDLVVGCHGIHHIYNLGNTFYQIHKGLKKEGLIYLYEWVGPNYLQIPIVNHVIASILLLLLFPSRAIRKTHANKVKGCWLQYHASGFDPSEACNSQELLPQFIKYFKPIKIFMHGGLTYLIFEGIAQNIDQTKTINKIKIRLVFYIELVLTKLNIIKPCFMVVIGEKRQLMKEQSNMLLIINKLKKIKKTIKDYKQRLF